MKRTTKIISAVVLTIGLTTGATAYATYKGGYGEAQAVFMVSYIGSELSLNDSQKQQLEVLSEKLLAVKKTMKAQGDPLHKNIQALINADKFDQQKALTMMNEKMTMINEKAPEVLAAIGDFLDGLNSEQKAEVLQFIEKKHEGHGRGWKHH